MTPTKAATNCTKPGCNGLIRNDVCSGCGPKRRQRDKAHDDRRGTAHQRGYGATWRRLRLMQLSNEPLCFDCKKVGNITIATDVHHIRARRDGGEDTLDNLMSLCHSCHSIRTNRGE